MGSHSPRGCHIDAPSELSYLHPDDANWKSADRYKPSGPTLSAPFSAPKASRMRTRTSSSTPLRPIRHSSPLVSQSDLFKLNADDDFSQVRTPRSGYGYDADSYGERTRQPKRFERSLERSDSRNGKKPERRFDSGSSSYSKPSTSRFVRDFCALLFFCVLIRIVSRIRNRATGTSRRTRRSMTRIESGPRFNLQNVIEPSMKLFPGLGSFPPKVRLITPGQSM